MMKGETSISFFPGLPTLFAIVILVLIPKAPNAYSENIKSFHELLNKAAEAIDSDPEFAKRQLNELNQLDPMNGRVEYYLNIIKKQRSGAKRKSIDPSLAGNFTLLLGRPIFEYKQQTNFIKTNTWLQAVIYSEKATSALMDSVELQIKMYTRFSGDFYNIFLPNIGPSPYVLAIYDWKTNYLGDLLQKKASGSQFGFSGKWTSVPAMCAVESHVKLNAGRIENVHLPGMQYANPDEGYLPPGDYFIQLLVKPALIAQPSDKSQSDEKKSPDCSGTDILLRSNVIKVKLTL